MPDTVGDADPDDPTPNYQGLHHHCTTTAPSLRVISRHVFVGRADLFCLEPSLHHHHPVTPPPLVLESLEHAERNVLPILNNLLEAHHHCNTIPAPSLPHHVHHHDHMRPPAPPPRLSLLSEP
jgi:hypothetical protein